MGDIVREHHIEFTRSDKQISESQQKLKSQRPSM